MLTVNNFLILQMVFFVHSSGYLEFHFQKGKKISYDDLAAPYDLMWLYQRRAFSRSAEGGPERASNTTASAWEG